MQLFKRDDLCLYMPEVGTPVSDVIAPPPELVMKFVLIYDVVYHKETMTGPIYIIWVSPGIPWVALHGELRSFRWAFRYLLKGLAEEPLEPGDDLNRQE